MILMTPTKKAALEARIRSAGMWAGKSVRWFEAFNDPDQRMSGWYAPRT
jgi:hypothetical protein